MFKKLNVYKSKRNGLLRLRLNCNKWENILIEIETQLQWGREWGTCP